MHRRGRGGGGGEGCGGETEVVKKNEEEEVNGHQDLPSYANVAFICVDDIGSHWVCTSINNAENADPIIVKTQQHLHDGPFSSFNSVAVNV